MAETGTDYHVEPDGSLRAEPTPGPWTVRLPYVPSSHLRHIDAEGIPLSIATVWGYDELAERMGANAALMAEAWRIPALRAALEQIEASAEGWKPAGGFGIDRLIAASKALREIRDIAREARGEQT